MKIGALIMISTIPFWSVMAYAQDRRGPISGYLDEDRQSGGVEMRFDNGSKVRIESNRHNLRIEGKIPMGGKSRIGGEADLRGQDSSFKGFYERDF